MVSLTIYDEARISAPQLERKIEKNETGLKTLADTLQELQERYVSELNSLSQKPINLESVSEALTSLKTLFTQYQENLEAYIGKSKVLMDLNNHYQNCLTFLSKEAANGAQWVEKLEKFQKKPLEIATFQPLKTTFTATLEIQGINFPVVSGATPSLRLTPEIATAESSTSRTPSESDDKILETPTKRRRLDPEQKKAQARQRNAEKSEKRAAEKALREQAIQDIGHSKADSELKFIFENPGNNTAAKKWIQFTAKQKEAAFTLLDLEKKHPYLVLLNRINSISNADRREPVIKTLLIIMKDMGFKKEWKYELVSTDQASFKLSSDVLAKNKEIKKILNNASVAADEFKKIIKYKSKRKSLSVRDFVLA